MIGRLYRPLRVFPFDPEVDRRGRTLLARVPLEHVAPGPVGRLVRVVDYDPVRKCFYEPIDLDAPGVLLKRGLDLAVHDPQFHQQMVYAVVMRVLEVFENALGRPFRWRGEKRLLVVPHAFEGANAYFDPDPFALLFGYFSADEATTSNLPGETVYTCLSNDVIAHETAHAIVHRLREGYSIATNPDVLAFHEGFADIVAILHRFTYPELVAEQIREHGANLTAGNPLVQLATQFGHASGGSEPLRSFDRKPSASDYRDAKGEHDRGQVLAAAVVDAFLRSVAEASAGTIRLATAGTGVLSPGALHPVLVDQLTALTTQIASHFLAICVRAFDFLPPVDLTFADYLRAAVTADFELFPQDERHYRANLIEAFRIRGILPIGATSLAALSVRLEPDQRFMDSPLPDPSVHVLAAAQAFDRRDRSRTRMVDDESDETVGLDDTAVLKAMAAKLHRWAVANPDRMRKLGLLPGAAVAVTGFHMNLRHDADGYPRSQFVVQFVQRTERDPSLGGMRPVGGTTVIADGQGVPRYVINKPLPTAGDERMGALKNHVADLEHRLGAAVWASSRADRIERALNLRGIDARR